jgi:hypothetical protein
MPITNTPLTKSEFEYLQQNITDQLNSVETAGVLAQSGLHFIVLLQIDAPEIDLVNPFFDQLQRSEGLANTTAWIPAVTALNNHAVTRGTSGLGSASDRLNTYLENGGNRILVSADYASMSQTAGYAIDPCYIDPGTTGGCLPGFTSALAVFGVIGTPFSYTLTAVGTPTITFTITGTLPPGLTFNGINLISGTPSGPSAVSTITMTATNSVGETDKTLTITITSV